jgi:ApbE superfamily uncharacterized protein (UPF0280 family)
MSAAPAALAVERGAGGALRARLADGRWHFQQGPIDLILAAWGAPEECARAYAQAWARFPSVLPELVAELPALRTPIAVPSRQRRRPKQYCRPREGGDPHGLDARTAERVAHAGMGPRFRADDSYFEATRHCPLSGPVARRMWRACAPLARVFVTPMAAVAGAVADEILAAMTAGRALRRAYVNNGGDIALHLAPGERFETGIVGDLAKPKIAATANVAAEDPVRGIATSGWRGRSFSLGIADAVTVLARDAAAADAAATLIANAVDVEHPAIVRRPARELDPDSDLGERPVTIAVGALDSASIRKALARGRQAAETFREDGQIAAAYVELAGHRLAIGATAAKPALPYTDMVWSLRA